MEFGNALWLGKHSNNLDPKPHQLPVPPIEYVQKRFAAVSHLKLKQHSPFFHYTNVKTDTEQNKRALPGFRLSS